MDITIYPQKLAGTISVIPSKSQAHRLLICAAFADKQTVLICPQTNRDIEATAACLQALGANIKRENDKYIIEPITTYPQKATLPCGESGSTLRFMLPIIGALGVDATFLLEGRLPQRPLSPLWEEMERMGCSLSRPTENTIHCSGKLRSGDYTIDGGISSQYITGLLFSLALMKGYRSLTVTGKSESKPYVDMTQQAMAMFGIQTESFSFHEPCTFRSPGCIHVEGDWSNAAFFLAANSLDCHIHIQGLNEQSKQGDRIISELLFQLRQNCTISAADIPDLIPILSVVAAVNEGAVFTDIQRLRLKESDRVASVRAMLKSLGIQTDETDNTLTIYPGVIHGGTVDAMSDHRIAMSAAIAATAADGPITIISAQCVNKSYPSFWEEYRKLGGSYEQHLW